MHCDDVPLCYLLDATGALMALPECALNANLYNATFMIDLSLRINSV